MVKKSLLSLRHDRRGAMLILIVLCLPVVLAFTAFAINVAWMQLTRTELRTATDASARAASRMLSRTQDPDAARAKAIAVAGQNTVAGAPLLLNNADVMFGNSTPDPTTGAWVFTTQADTASSLNGVRINGSRTAGSASGPIPLLFAGVFSTGTFQPSKTAVASHMDRDVFLVLDRSGSMATGTPGGNRWIDLKKAVKAFLDALNTTPQDELVGLATYSTASTLDLNMSTNYNQIKTSVNGKTVSGMTAIGLGLQSGLNGVLNTTYARPNAAKTIVLMTDGIHNTGVAPEGIATAAHNTHNVTVHTVTFSSGADQTRMATVAANGGGRHWHADDQAQLIQAFEEIANNLPTLITE